MTDDERLRGMTLWVETFKNSGRQIYNCISDKTSTRLNTEALQKLKNTSHNCTAENNIEELLNKALYQYKLGYFNDSIHTLLQLGGLVLYMAEEIEFIWNNLNSQKRKTEK